MCKHPVLPIVELQSVTRTETESGKYRFLCQRPASRPGIASYNSTRRQERDSFVYDERRIARFLAIGSRLCTISFA